MKKLTITGNIGQNAEIKANSTTGELFATFSVGVNVGTKTQPKTDWIKVTTSRVDFAKAFITKGRKVLVEGFPKTNAWINKDGVAVAEIQVNPHIIELMGRVEANDQDDAATTDNNEVNDQE